MKAKKMLAMLITLCMLLSLLPATALADGGTTVSVTSETTSWTDGNTYVVSGTVTIPSRISVSGSVTLRLNAGSLLNAQCGINLYEGNTLTIEGSGTLLAVGNTNGNYGTDGNAGIGSERQGTAGTLIVNGGTINATGGQYAAGIGGGTYGRGGTVIINGGTVNANGTYTGAGIGGGGNRNWGGDYGHSGAVTINGGVVNAHGAGYGAGIGGGGANSTGTVKAGHFDRDVVINGGQVTATSDNGYGIGPGSRSDGTDAPSGGSITLGWTNASDFIQVSSYKGALTFSVPFLLDGTDTVATAANAGGAKLVPGSSMPVTFETFGGTQVPGQNVSVNGTVQRPADPVRAGSVFKGWYQITNGRFASSAWDFSTPVTGKVTLGAAWGYGGTTTCDSG
ncbi:MAG: InlB B-repeat-containing protein, partial [Oscillospiraceae bacterium]|nr:InlB B-repeat-containing protein [Oscillospiraceae bacterium]